MTLWIQKAVYIFNQMKYRYIKYLKFQFLLLVKNLQLKVQFN